MIIKHEKELQALKEGGRLLARILDKVAQIIRPGITTIALDEKAEHCIRDVGGIPSFKGYRARGAPNSYPASLCVSLNDEVVHGIPSPDRIIQEGDVVGLDIGMQYNGYFTDTARTIIVPVENSNGNTEKKINSYLDAKYLIEITKRALDEGISYVRAGIHVGDIGFVIQQMLEDSGLSVVRELVGHGVGRAVHEDPEIPNWGIRGSGYMLHEGEVIALEPMATLGKPKVKLLKDGWTWVTNDGSLSAHFEHTLVVTKNGREIITKL